jgi:hypothetical protein
MAASFKHERARKLIVSIRKRINSAEDDDAQEAAAPASFGGEFGTKGLGFECRSMVEAAGATAADRLLGTTPEMQAEVSQWLSFASTFDAAKTKPKNLKINGRLQLLNMHLEDRTVFAGRGVAISLADLSMFAVVHEIVSDEESYPELVQLPHLLRWIKAKTQPPRPSHAFLSRRRSSILLNNNLQWLSRVTGLYCIIMVIIINRRQDCCEIRKEDWCRSCNSISSNQ